jgi:hypothetical protein
LRGYGSACVPPGADRQRATRDWRVAGGSPSRPGDLSRHQCRAANRSLPRGGAYPRMGKSRDVRPTTDRVRPPMTRRASQVANLGSLARGTVETCVRSTAVLRLIPRSRGSLLVPGRTSVHRRRVLLVLVSRETVRPWCSSQMQEQNSRVVRGSLPDCNPSGSIGLSSILIT